MELLKELKGLLLQLNNPKFLAHLLEPVLLWGVLFGVIAWLLSVWVLKHRQAQVCSLVMLALSSFCIFPVLHYRAKARPISAPSSRLLNEQNDRRKNTQWVYYAMGTLAVAGLLLTGEGKGKLGFLVTVGISAAGVATIVFSLWLHEKEIAIFHGDARRNLRAALAPRWEQDSQPTAPNAGGAAARNRCQVRDNREVG